VKLSLTNSYAIAAMVHIVDVPDGQAVSNTTVCEACKMPKRYVLQLMRMLVVANLLVSIRGVAGGYKLTKPANKITLLNIVEAVDGPLGQNDYAGLPPMSRNAKTAVEGAFAAIEGGGEEAASCGHPRGLAGGEGDVSG
jgi:Rrf2 family protein